MNSHYTVNVSVVELYAVDVYRMVSDRKLKLFVTTNGLSLLFEATSY